MSSRTSAESNKCPVKQVNGGTHYCSNKCLDKQASSQTSVWSNMCTVNRCPINQGSCRISVKLNKSLVEQVFKCRIKQVSDGTSVLSNKCLVKQVPCQTSVQANKLLVKQVSGQTCVLSAGVQSNNIPVELVSG